MALDHMPSFDALLVAIESAKGETDAKTRRAILCDTPTAGALGAYAIKVAHNAASVSDQTVRALVAGGISEGAVFEATIAAATSAAVTRLDRGLALLKKRGPKLPEAK